MKNILMAILIVVSLLMLDVRVVLCQESVASKQLRREDSSTQQPPQSVQSQGAPVTGAGQTTPVKLDGKAQKIKRTVEKIGVAGRLTLYLKNGEELYGSVVTYNEESVQIAEIDLKQVVTIQYRNVKKVREDYGKRDLITGRRSNPAKGIKIGVAVGLLFLAVGLPLIAIAGMKD